ncbi:MAG: mechanosensitive ion channel family protein [Candidatus Bathyarchaeota archaeon]
MTSLIQGIFDHPILILQILVTIIGAFLAVTIFNFLISRLEKGNELQKGKFVYLRRFFQIIIYLSALIVVFSLVDIDLTGVIAGLGVGALVIGFGLKDIIENWVSGILTISGKTYAIGDVIRVGDLTGTVTDIALRSTKMKTYDRNEIIIPNSVLMREKIINLTGGTSESVASINISIDYTADLDDAKKIIEQVLKNQKNVIVDQKKRREIRFILRNKEWINEIEILFWINNPSQEEFIKSNITELIQKEFKKEGILPPIPALMRKEYLSSKKTLVKWFFKQYFNLFNSIYVGNFFI